MVNYEATATKQYGDDAEPAALDGAGESSALLGGAPRRSTLSEGRATIASCIGNLCNTIIGSGMLTFPLAMASAGIIPGMLTCLLSGTVASFGLYLLSLCAAKTPHRKSSFFAVAQMTFPRAAVFFDAAIAIKCFGVSISYLIIIKGLMPNVVESLFHDLAPNAHIPGWMLSGRNWIVLFMIPLVPLAFMKQLHSLRHTSYVAMFAVAYLIIIVISTYFVPLEGMPEKGEVHLIHFTPSFVSLFPVQVFAFTCAQNLFPLYNELKSNTQERMNVVVGGSIGIATLVYEIISVFGYLTFGTKVGANIIAMYPSTSLFIAVGQVAIVILVLFSYPLQVHPCRNCLDKIIHAGQAAENLKVGAGEEETDEHGLAVVEMSMLKHAIMTCSIVVSGFTIAYFVDDLQMVLSFVGSTGSTTISFILPGLFYWKLSRDDPEKKTLNKLALALACYGVFVFIFCLTFNIYAAVTSSKGPAH
ncbi:hypothetical protein CYLTODRAFT_389544 [Cylindrobasidium torrendii FP15055 ss-10]|uniref:Amino acid transporter transmembrane domain-containing protein n=1 Tax=Cylindrobasidium torrendii FP15055 ss-10 TaxID=1314674 RepID=A0A0D7BNT7_9AGAR|nr:hypothetical protein CYLTODRAFT_389544 [Cylindrobasidium torrendii FP15055 ss-10]